MKEVLGKDGSGKELVIKTIWPEVGVGTQGSSNSEGEWGKTEVQWRVTSVARGRGFGASVGLEFWEWLKVGTF